MEDRGERAPEMQGRSWYETGGHGGLIKMRSAWLLDCVGECRVTGWQPPAGQKSVLGPSKLQHRGGGRAAWPRCCERLAGSHPAAKSCL